MGFTLVIATIFLAVSVNSKHVDFIKLGPKIIGGAETWPHSIPYQVAINAFDYFCGGTLISTEWVLTSAKCVSNDPQPQVVLGAHNLNDLEEPSQVRVMANQTILHEQFDLDDLINDIALVQFYPPVILNEYIQPVALPQAGLVDNDFAGYEGTLSGWGKIADLQPNFPARLRNVNATIINMTQCNDEAWAIFPIPDTNICTTGRGVKGACAGDNGGPLTANINGIRTLVGTLSYEPVSSLCEYEFPSIFTRITKYLDWIKINSGIEITK